jgi:hypothetical protein
MKIETFMQFPIFKATAFFNTIPVDAGKLPSGMIDQAFFHERERIVVS